MYRQNLLNDATPKNGKTEMGKWLSLTEMMLDDTAQGLVEYALIIALVALVAIAGLTIFSHRFTNVTNSVTTSLGDT